MIQFQQSAQTGGKTEGQIKGNVTELILSYFSRIVFLIFRESSESLLLSINIFPCKSVHAVPADSIFEL